MKESLPGLEIKDVFEVLGAMVKTTARSKTVDAVATTHAVRSLAHEIGHLPISIQKKAFLLSAKVIAKFLYLPEIHPWPKITLDGMIGTIAQALWGDRPHWRSAHLLFANLTNPTRCHPVLAVAARVISNIVERCRKDEFFLGRWIELCKQKRIVTRGILDAFTKACLALDIQFIQPLQFEFLGITFHALDMSPKCIRRLCRVAAVQSLYRDAVHSNRKDLVSTGSGVVDVDLCHPWAPPRSHGAVMMSMLRCCRFP